MITTALCHNRSIVDVSVINIIFVDDIQLNTHSQYTSEAVYRWFAAHGNRDNRAREM